MKNYTFRGALLSSFFVLMTAQIAHAQQATLVQAEVTAPQNAQERINFSGKMRMLSQRIPAAACHLGRGIDPEGAMALLTGATVELEKILTALEFGDPDLNIIAPETRRKSIARLHDLREVWVPLQTAAQAIIAGTATDADYNYVLTENLPVLRAAQLVVEELVKQYSNPNAATRASLMLIDISGRQRMLTQKMSKESCMIGTDYETDTTINDLAGTMRIFEASLEALRFGMSEVGIMPPPNTTISDGLDGVVSDWSVARPHVAGAIAGDDIAGEAKVQRFQGLNVTMATMNRVVGLYADAAGPK